MADLEKSAGLRMRTRAVNLAVAVATMAFAVGPAQALTQSWNGYHWARTGTLQIALGDNVGAAWDPYLRETATAWSAANNIDFALVAGRSTAACAAVYGTVQVCSGNYGRTNWLGYTNVYTSGGFVVQATVRLNDYYFATPAYNTAAWRQHAICHEIGHTLGLDHADAVNSNPNIGSCLDLTRAPGGGPGNLSNVNPGANDFAALDGIYAQVDATQLAQTKPQFRAAHALGIDGTELEFAVTSVPEPSTWALLIAGFGLVGGAMRRRTAATARA